MVGKIAVYLTHEERSFAKTGSGQIQGKLKNRNIFAGRLATTRTVRWARSSLSRHTGERVIPPSFAPR
jgi:hypothetical protein